MPGRLEGKVIPDHIAIILDGNGRWAKRRGLPRALGHKAGCDALEQTVRDCAKIGVKYLTVYGFSTENWKRSEEEVSALMNLFRIYLKKLIGTFVDLSANISRRGDNYIVYIKKAQYISDLLGIMGADNAVLEFENIRISKSLHGDVQRMLNCDNANVDRTLSAAEEQRGWIRKIAEDELGREPLASELADPGSVFWTDGLRHLPSQLKEVAFIRLYKPEASLAEIGETLNPPIGKPAVSKRFARLKAMAEM